MDEDQHSGNTLVPSTVCGIIYQERKWQQKNDCFLTQSKLSQVIESDYDTDDVVADLLGLQKTQKVKIKEVTYCTRL